MDKIKSCEKYIVLFFVVFINALLPFSNLFASGMLIGQNVSSSRMNIPSPIEFNYNDLQIYKPIILIDGRKDMVSKDNEASVEFDTASATPKKRPLLSVVNERTIFTDINSSQEGEVSTHIISPETSDDNQMKLSAIHRCKIDKSERSDAVGGLVRYQVSDFTFGAKYMTGLNLVELSDDNQTQKENSWGFSLKYQIADPLVFDIHYEEFDSDTAENDVPVDKQYGISATYSFSLISESDCRLTSGYRKIEYDTSGYYGNQVDLDEFLILFNWGF